MTTIVAVDIGGTHMRAASYSQGDITPDKYKRIRTLASEPGGFERLIGVIEEVWIARSVGPPYWLFVSTTQ